MNDKMEIVTYDPIDAVCNSLENFQIENSVNTKMIKDLDSITFEICKQKYGEIDIYDACISCGSSLTWDYEYEVSQNDLKWLQDEGFKRFMYLISTYHIIDNQEKYNFFTDLYKKIFDLFSLQATSHFNYVNYNIT